MRPASNLRSNPDFQVSKAELRQGFLAFYNGRLGVNQYEAIFRIVTASLYSAEINIPGSPDLKDLKKFGEKCVRDKTHSWMVQSSLRFDAPSRSFEYRVPIFRVQTFGEHLPVSAEVGMVLRSMNKQWTQAADQVPMFSETRLGGGRIMSGAEISAAMHAPQHTRNCVAEAIKHVEAEKVGNYIILWATFRIEHKEAEYLNNTPIMEIKLGNFYPSLLEWATTVWGEEGNVPKTITPIATISRDVKSVLEATPVRPRVGVDGMVMDIHNEILIIPEVDNSALYEQRLMDFGLRDNGSYSWSKKKALQVAEDEDGEGEGQGGQQFRVGDPANQDQQGPSTLPINMPIFTDWLNDKFAYSNSAGNLAVYDLSNTVPVTNFHLLKVLNEPLLTKIETTTMLATLRTAFNACVQYDNSITRERPTDAERKELERSMGRILTEEQFNSIFGRPASNLGELIQKAQVFHKMAVGHTADLFVHGSESVARAWQAHPTNGLLTYRFVGRVFAKMLEMVQGNQEAMYRHYSVLTVLGQQAILTVLSKYSERHAEITEADKAERDPYLTQGVDPTHPVGPIALVKENMKFMPHQAKVDNLMRKHPKSAIYGVAAGGGKTILILTNILREIKAGVCRKPIVMCPPHLVAQYVEEVVYVTEGRLNIIPITNVSFKSHGPDALAKMINSAPPNTVVVTDYDFVKGKSEEVAYGNKTVTVYKNAEFLRQFEFDLVALDESHFLKNTSSGRRDATARFIQDIPYKRLASGTFVADTIKDVVSQVALIDPTIFGSEEQFKREFAEEVRGGKVLSWKDGAERMVRERINDHVVFAEAKRKEWAALLPQSEEMFYAVSLTENQRLLYQSILEETTELIREAMARRADLREAMESEDETKAEDLERMLRPYMARLERYLSAPEMDPAGEIFLKDAEDRVSPKLQKMYEIIQDHIAQGLPGKVLVFTQYLPTAEAAYLNAPTELRNQGIHYTADEKLQARADFESNDEKRWMVGQSSSMDTGLNFQHVSRLIRLETVWTPGVLEQGNSRINRPQLKKDETRARIYFDWIMVNQTIDVTKISRLISKVISKAKFDEYDNPAYQEIDNLPPVAITLESIAANNNFEEELQPYLFAYEKYQKVQEADYREYREQNGDRIEPVPVPQGGMLEGSKLMARVPYIPGMNVYGAGELGLLRYDQFVRQDIDTVDDADIERDEEDEEEVELGPDGNPTDPKAAVRKALKEMRAKERALAKYKPCHTEYGDGEITAIGNKHVRIRLNNGTKVRLEKMKVFIITRGQTNAKDMRNELLKMVGNIPIDTPITVPVEEGPAIKAKKGAKKIEQVVDSKPTVTLAFSIINDMLTVVYNSPGTGDPVLPILQNLGFIMAPEYKFARMQNHRVLLRLFHAFRDHDFKIDKHMSSIFKEVYNTYKERGKAGIAKFGFTTKMEFKNFYREEIKPSASPTDLKIYPQIQDGELYVILPTRGQTGNLKAARIPVQSVRWKDGGGDTEFVRFVQTKEQAKEVVKAILDRGVAVANLDELGEQFKAIRMGRKA
jgi:hypothetical protein